MSSPGGWGKCKKKRKYRHADLQDAGGGRWDMWNRRRREESQAEMRRREMRGLRRKEWKGTHLQIGSGGRGGAKWEWWQMRIGVCVGARGGEVEPQRGWGERKLQDDNKVAASQKRKRRARNRSVKEKERERRGREGRGPGVCTKKKKRKKKNLAIFGNRQATRGRVPESPWQLMLSPHPDCCSLRATIHPGRRVPTHAACFSFLFFFFS